MSRKIPFNQIRAIAHKSGIPVPLIQWRVMMGYPLDRIMEHTYENN